MRKYLILIMLIPILSACSNKISDNINEKKSSSESISISRSNTTNSMASSSIENSASTEFSKPDKELKKPSTDNGNRDINSKDEVVTARRKLYEAGVNSSNISDDDMKKYVNDAKEKNEDIVKYIKENFINK